MNENRKTGPVSPEEARALRECAVILAPLHAPEERRQIALSIERLIQGQETSLVPFRFFQVAALFYPGDKGRAQSLEAKLHEALASGDLVTVLPHDQRGILLTELAAWPDCPAVPWDSPLRYWLPASLHEPQTERMAAGSQGLTPVQWIEFEPGTTEIEFQELPFLLADAKAKAGDDEGLTAARAFQFENELGLLVDKGLVPLKNPLTGGPHEFPHGNARDTAIIRVQDLDEFLRKHYAIGVRTRPTPGGKGTQDSSTEQPGSQAMQRSRAQDTVILSAILAAGYDPKRLPKNPSGRRGVKAEIREAVTKSRRDLFPEGSTTFKKAWERLCSHEDIKYEAP